VKKIENIREFQKFSNQIGIKSGKKYLLFKLFSFNLKIINVSGVFSLFMICLMRRFVHVVCSFRLCPISNNMFLISIQA